MHRRYVMIRKSGGHDAGGSHAAHHNGSPVMRKVLAKADAPPEYWQTQVAQPDGHMTLVRQEYNELMVAIKSGNVPAIKQELEDLAAVSIMALRHT